MKPQLKMFRKTIGNLARGFTLLEMLVATSILVVIMGVIVMAMDFTVDSWRRTTGSVTAFENSRVAFTQLNELLSQATLNTYADYYNDTAQTYRTKNNTKDFEPTSFKRQSELHFISGPAADSVFHAGIMTDASGVVPDSLAGHCIFFQAPLNFTEVSAFSPVEGLLNSLGFYLEYQDQAEELPEFIQTLYPSESRWRFRLMQWIMPTEDFSVYRSTSTDGYDKQWFELELKDSDIGKNVVVAENIVQLILMPKLDPSAEIAAGVPELDADGKHIAPTFYYDSRGWEDPNYAVTNPSFSNAVSELTRNQLPPMIEVVMIAIDEASATRLEEEKIRAGQDPSTPPDALIANVDGQELFQEARYLEDDLRLYEQKLASNGVTFRVFRNTLAVNSAKWSPTD